MRKRVLPVLLALFVTVSVTAQNTFNEGDNVLNLGLGLGSHYYGIGYSTVIPPLSASYEVGIKDELFDENSSLGVGGIIGFSNNRFSVHGDNFSNFVIGGRGSLHYQFIDKLDTYAGLMLGLRHRSKYYLTPSRMYLATGAYLGGRYYFNETFAGMMELGYGIAYLNIGIALKL